MNKCQPVALGVAIGSLWALYVFLLVPAALWFGGWGAGLVAPLASLYLGYGLSLGGAVIGALWAFGDGFLAGVVIAWIYNKMAR
ncbi:MAG: bacteriophage holin [Patescibacteria group bacterium]|nr:bacteriophage holin [Patescibacteria group bacterium]